MTTTDTADLDRCLDAFMTVVERLGWRQTSLENIAKEVGLPVWQLVLIAGNRFDMLEKFGRRADIAALRSVNGTASSQGTRDRLFDVFMARFDALQPYRGAIRKLAQATCYDPALAAFFARRLPHTVAILAEAAGLNTRGLAGMARVHGLTLLYASVSRTWLRDDSEDMSRTMAALDQALARADRWCRRFDWDTTEPTNQSAA